MNDCRSRPKLRPATAVILAVAFALLAPVLSSNVARANPRPLPFTYQSETLPAGAVEVEQFVDFLPLRATNAVSGERVWLLASQFQTEFEVGLTDRLELGLYVTYVPTFGAAYFETPQLPSGNGAKQRLRYR